MFKNIVLQAKAVTVSNESAFLPKIPVRTVQYIKTKAMGKYKATWKHDVTMI